MKPIRLNLLAATAVGVILGRSAQADTILTFDARPAGQDNNAPIIQSFGDNVGGSKAGITAIGFATPDIALSWSGPDGGGRWDYYVDPVWSAGQLDGSGVDTTHSILFTPEPTAAVNIKSFNFHPYYNNGLEYIYTWSVTDGANVLTNGGPLLVACDATKNHPVNINYSGSLGQALTLRITRTGGNDNTQNIAVDDIRFAQLPEVLGPYITSIAPAPGQNPTSPDAPFDATLANGVSALVPNSIRLSLNGSTVSPSVTTVAGSTSVSFKPPALLPSKSTNQYTLTYRDNNNPPQSYTNLVSFVIAPYANLQLPAPLHFQNFNSVGEGMLPAGWTVQNFTSPLTPGIDPNSVLSDFYLNWAVVSRETVTNIANPAAGYLDIFNVRPFQVVNSQVVTGLTSSNLLLAASDGRLGAQIQYVFTGDYNLSGSSGISLSFHSLYTQNQDSLGSVEYSINGGTTWLPALYLLDGPDILRDGAGQIDASNTLATVYGDVPDLTTMQPQNGYYGAFIGVAREQWATLGPYLSARVNDDTTESKRVEVIRLAQADNQPAVRFRFASAGSDSWHFGIDDFGLYSGTVMPPVLGAVTPASRTDYVGATSTFNASASGIVPLGYQWRRNGTNLPGQTSSTLSLPHIQSSDAGNYTVVVTSGSLSATSSPPVTLSVLPTPSCGVTEDLTVYLNFDNNIAAQSGTTVNGAVMSGAERYAPGVIGQAASFRNDAGAGGPSDWAVTLGNQDALYAGNFTVAFWLKTAVNGDGALTGNKDWNSGGNTGWLMDQYDVGYLNFRADGGTRYDLGPEIRDGVWHHLALSVHRDTNGFMLYLDGAPVATGRIGPTGTESLGAGYDTLIGGSGPGSYSGFGDIDDYAIWVRALSTEELTCVYANAFIGKSVDQLPSNPRLRMSPEPFGDLRIYWGSVFIGYTLECSTTLGPGAAWGEVLGVDNNSVIIGPAGPSKFFRLRKP